MSCQNHIQRRVFKFLAIIPFLVVLFFALPALATATEEVIIIWPDDAAVSTITKEYDGHADATVPVVFPVTLELTALPGVDILEEGVLEVEFTTAVYNSPDVDTASTVTITATLTGMDAMNYHILAGNEFKIYDGVITPKAAMAYFEADDKVYDGTTDATGSVYYWDVNLVRQDIAGATLTFEDPNAALSVRVDATFSGGVSSNYNVTLTTDPVYADISPRPVDVIVDPNLTKEFDGTNSAEGRAYYVDVDSNEVEIAGAVLTYDDENVGTNKTVTATNLILDPNYAIDTVYDGLADITPLGVDVIVAPNPTKVFDGDNSAEGRAYFVIWGITEVDIDEAVLTYDDENVGINKTVTATNLVLDPNYEIDNVYDGFADITPFDVDVYVEADDKTFDGKTEATGSVSFDDIDGYLTAVTSADLSFDDSSVGTNKVVYATNIVLPSANYSVGNVFEGAAAITPAEITISAITLNNVDNYRKYWDNTADIADPTADIHYTFSGLVTGFTDVKATAAGYAFAAATAGDHAIEVTGIALDIGYGDNDCYELTTISGVTEEAVTIDPFPVTVALVLPASKVYDGSTGISITSYEIIPGIPESFPVGAGPEVTVSADADLPGAGSQPIHITQNLTGSQAGNYVLNTPLHSSHITITPRPVLLTPNDNQWKYCGTFVGTEAPLAYQIESQNGSRGKLAADNLLISNTLSRTAGELVGEYAISQGSLVCGNTNYALEFLTGKVFTVKALDTLLSPILSLPVPDGSNGWYVTGVQIMPPAGFVTIATEQNPGSVWVPFFPTTDGIHAAGEITYYLRNSSNEITIAVQSPAYKRDTQVPKDLSISKRGASIVFTATDNIGVVTMDLLRNNTLITTVEGADGSYTVITPGTYTFQATDDAGLFTVSEKGVRFEDSDNDGICDEYESLVLLTDSLSADTDGDGLSDYDEFIKHKTDPLKPDTDGDGLLDQQELTLGFSPISADTDNDGINDMAAYTLGLLPGNDAPPAAAQLLLNGSFILENEAVIPSVLTGSSIFNDLESWRFATLITCNDVLAEAKKAKGEVQVSWFNMNEKRGVGMIGQYLVSFEYGKKNSFVISNAVDMSQAMPALEGCQRISIASQDGTALLLANWDAAASRTKGNLVLVDLTSMKMVVLSDTDNLSRFDLAKDASSVAYIRDGKLSVFYLSKGEIIPYDAAASTLAYQNDGSLLINVENQQATLLGVDRTIHTAPWTGWTSTSQPGAGAHHINQNGMDILVAGQLTLNKNRNVLAYIPTTENPIALRIKLK